MNYGERYHGERVHKLWICGYQRTIANKQQGVRLSPISTTRAQELSLLGSYFVWADTISDRGQHPRLRSEGDCTMITERLQHLIDEIAALPPEEQDRVAAAMQIVLRQQPSNRLPCTPRSWLLLSA